MNSKIQVDGIGLFANKGFILETFDDHILLLIHEGEVISRFSQTGATEQSLQDECSRHLVKSHGWDGCIYKNV